MYAICIILDEAWTLNGCQVCSVWYICCVLMKKKSFFMFYCFTIVWRWRWWWTEPSNCSAFTFSFSIIIFVIHFFFVLRYLCCVVMFRLGLDEDYTNHKWIQVHVQTMLYYLWEMSPLATIKLSFYFLCMSN